LELSDTTVIDFGINVDLGGQVCRLHRRWQLPVARRDYESVHLYCFLLTVFCQPPIGFDRTPCDALLSCRFKIISTTELHSVPLAPHFESFAWLRCHLCAKKMHNGTLQIGWLRGRSSGEFVPNKRNSVVLGTSSFIALSFMRKEFRVLCD